MNLLREEVALWNPSFSGQTPLLNIASVFRSDGQVM